VRAAPRSASAPRRPGSPRLLVALLAALACASPPPLEEGPRLVLRNRLNPVPRPFADRTHVPVGTSLYFEVGVPDAHPASVDPDSITARLAPEGGESVDVILPGRRFAPGFRGATMPVKERERHRGHGFHVIPERLLDPDRLYTVEVRGETEDGRPLEAGSGSWSFRTRPELRRPRVGWSVDLAAPTVRFEGGFFRGIVKPSFETSRFFHQLDSYELMQEVRELDPRAWSLQRDVPLTGDYWNHLWDGNPNLVRERETRRVVAVASEGDETRLTLAPLPEGPLYGIADDRPLAPDYAPGDTVTIADHRRFEAAQVRGVDESARVVRVGRLSTPPEAWVLERAGSPPPEQPETRDHFTLPLAYLRKLDPPGTPVYYWSRLDHEWDLVHGRYDRDLVVNFAFTPLDLAARPVPFHANGQGSIGPPKDWLQWHGFVREVVLHLIDRYGEAALGFWFSLGNETDIHTRWEGSEAEFHALYDVTANAVLVAFEERGLDAERVRVGGLEAGALFGGTAWVRRALLHASGAADDPEGAVQEANLVCADPRFAGRRAARTRRLCEAHGGRGAPLDFVSVHHYGHSAAGAALVTRVRDDALAMDPDFYDDLVVSTFETSPDWIPRSDPASRGMHLGNGYFPAWCADWIQRLVARAERDPRYARHDSLLTVWPFDYDGSGQTSVTGLLHVDEDGDGESDRVATVRKDVFNFLELLARTSPDLAALPAREIEGIRVAGVRSASPQRHVLLLYAHDPFDTEAVEDAEIRARLALAQVPWEEVSLRHWRVDRDHASPYAAYAELPDEGPFSPREVAAVQAADDLGPGERRRVAAPGGSLALEVALRANGVAVVEITEWRGE